MAIYPKEAQVNEEAIARLTDLYQKAYIRIAGEIEGATDFGVANRKAILAQIDAILADFSGDVYEFIETEIPAIYKVGAKDAVNQLRAAGADIQVKSGFNLLHKQAIAALVDDTASAFGEGMAGINRTARQILGRATKQLITQRIAEGLISGSSVRDVKNLITGILQNEGLGALVDKGGHTWTLDRYSEMLFRTKMVEARNLGLINRVAENGFDLVQVSVNGSEHEECRIWEGEILSLTGATSGYKTVSDATAAGLFHPNCKHALNVINPELAAITLAYNPQTEQYE